MRSVFWMLPLLGACAAEVATEPTSGEGGEDAPEQVVEEQTDPVSSEAPPVEEATPIETAPAAPRPETQIAALEQYWGNEWGGVLLRYIEAGVDLEGPVTFPPWSEVEVPLRAQVVPGESEQEKMIERHRGLSANPTALELGQLCGKGALEGAELERATAAAAAHFDEVDAHARILVDMLVDARTQVWESGSYSAAPLIGVRPPERGQIVLDSGLAQAKRWTVFWRVWSGDFPWVVEQRNIVRRVVRDRREAVIAAVAGE